MRCHLGQWSSICYLARVHNLLFSNTHLSTLWLGWGGFITILLHNNNIICCVFLFSLYLSPQTVNITTQIEWKVDSNTVVQCWPKRKGQLIQIYYYLGNIIGTLIWLVFMVDRVWRAIWSWGRWTGRLFWKCGVDNCIFRLCYTTTWLIVLESSLPRSCTNLFITCCPQQ